MAARCRKFVPNKFNKNKCQSCFASKETHSAEALEGSKAARKISKCSYLFVAPDLDFSNPLHKSKRWQRRFFVLYDDGELTYSVDDNTTTVPQGCVDMNKCIDVHDAEEFTSHEFSIGVVAPPQATLFVKGVSKEEIRRWFDVLVMYPRSLTIKTKRLPPKNATGLSLPDKNGNPVPCSDDEDKENAIINSSLDSDAYDRLSRSRSKAKWRDFRRSKSEVRPADLKQAGDAGLMLSESLPAPAALPLKDPSATPADIRGAAAARQTIVATPAVITPRKFDVDTPSSTLVAIAPSYGLAKPPVPATAERASVQSVGAPVIKEPLLTKRTEPETYSSVRSMKHKKLASTRLPAATTATGGSVLARSTSMQDVTSSGLTLSTAARESGDNDIAASRDDLSLLRSARTDTNGNAPSVSANDQAGGWHGSALQQHKAKTLYESLMHPASLPPPASRASGPPPGGGKDKWRAGGLGAYQQLASVPKARHAAAVEEVESFQGSGGNNLLLAVSGKLAVARSSTPLCSDGEESDNDRCLHVEAALSNETDEHKIAKGEHAKKPTGEKPGAVRKGWLLKQEANKMWVKHWFVLGGTVLAYYKDAKAEESNLVDGIIDIASCDEVSSVNGDRNHIFKIRTRDKDYFLSAMTIGIRRNWTDDIDKIKDEIKRAQEKNVKQNMGFVFVPPLRHGASAAVTAAADSLPPSQKTVETFNDRLTRNRRSDSVSTDTSIENEVSGINSESNFLFDAVDSSSHLDSRNSPALNTAAISASSALRAIRSSSKSTRASPSQRLKERSRSKTPPKVRSPPPPAMVIQLDEQAALMPQLFSTVLSGKQLTYDDTAVRRRVPDSESLIQQQRLSPLLLHPQPKHPMSVAATAVQQLSSTSDRVNPAIVTVPAAAKDRRSAAAPAPPPVADTLQQVAIASLEQTAVAAAAPLGSSKSLQEQNDQLQRELKIKADKILVLEKKVEHVKRLEEDCSSRSAKLVTLDKILANTRRHLEEAVEKARELELQHKSRLEELENEFDAERSEHNDKVHKLEERLEKFLNQSNIVDSLNSNMTDMMREKDDTIGRLEGLVLELQQKVQDMDDEGASCVQVLSENEMLKQRLSVLQNRLEYFERESHDTRLQLGSAQAQAESLLKQTKHKDKQLSATQQEAASLRAQCDDLVAHCRSMQQHDDHQAVAVTSGGDSLESLKLKLEQAQDEMTAAQTEAKRCLMEKERHRSAAAQAMQDQLSNAIAESSLAAATHWQGMAVCALKMATARVLATVTAVSANNGTIPMSSIGSFALSLSDTQRAVAGKGFIEIVDKELSSLSSQLACSMMTSAQQKHAGVSLQDEENSLLARISNIEASLKNASEVPRLPDGWQSTLTVCVSEVDHLIGNLEVLGKSRASSDIASRLGSLSTTLSTLLGKGAIPSTVSLLASYEEQNLDALCKHLALQAAVIDKMLSMLEQEGGREDNDILGAIDALKHGLHETGKDTELRDYCTLLTERLLISDYLDGMVRHLSQVGEQYVASGELSCGASDFAVQALALEATHRVALDCRLPSCGKGVLTAAAVHSQLTLLRESLAYHQNGTTAEAVIGELENLAAERRRVADHAASLADDYCARRAVDLAAKAGGGAAAKAADEQLAAVVRSLVAALLAKVLESGGGGGRYVADAAVDYVQKLVDSAREALLHCDAVETSDLKSALSKQAFVEARIAACMHRFRTRREQHTEFSAASTLSDGEKNALAATANQYERARLILSHDGDERVSNKERRHLGALYGRLVDIDRALELQHVWHLSSKPARCIMREVVFGVQLAVAQSRRDGGAQTPADLTALSPSALLAARVEADSLKASLADVHARLATVVQGSQSNETLVKLLRDEMAVMRDRHALELEESKKDMRMVLKSVKANEQRLETDLVGEIAILKQQMDAERTQHKTELNSLKESTSASATDHEQLEQQHRVLKEKVRELERCLHEMQEEFEEELYDERQAHIQELDARRQEQLNFLTQCEQQHGMDTIQIKAAYEKEINKLRAEQHSLQQWIDDIREAHKDEMEALQHERDEMLADEIGAARASLSVVHKERECRLIEERAASDRLRSEAAMAAAELERKIKIYLREIESKDKEIASLQDKESQNLRHLARVEDMLAHYAETLKEWQRLLARADEATTVDTATSQGAKQQSSHDLLKALRQAAAAMSASMSPAAVPQRALYGTSQRLIGSTPLQQQDSSTAMTAVSAATAIASQDELLQPKEEEEQGFQPANAGSHRQRRVASSLSGGRATAAIAAATRPRRLTHDGSQSFPGTASMGSTADKTTSVNSESLQDQHVVDGKAYSNTFDQSKPQNQLKKGAD